MAWLSGLSIVAPTPHVWLSTLVTVLGATACGAHRARPDSNTATIAVFAEHLVIITVIETGVGLEC